jgi:hypothetical protein
MTEIFDKSLIMPVTKQFILYFLKLHVENFLRIFENMNF